MSRCGAIIVTSCSAGFGFGFAGGKFVVMDVANTDVLSTASESDDNLKRAVPLKMVEDGDAFKLYAGKKWVSIKAA